LNVSGAYSTGLDPTLPNPTFQRWFNTCTLNQNNNTRQNCASPSEPVAWLIQKPFTLNTRLCRNGPISGAGLCRK
jgi:hypothetical protein